MTMPKNLFLVRHGESERNVVSRRLRAGDQAALTEEMKNVHTAHVRLTPRGVEQAKAAGEWLRENAGNSIERYYSSEYVRARETAANLELPGAQWRCVHFLRERDFGEVDNMTLVEREEFYARTMKSMRLHPFYGRLVGGESICDVADRFHYRFLNQLHRDCPRMLGVVAVCHGEVMEAARCVLEHVSPNAFVKRYRARDERLKIHNCQILHYTRIDPVTGAEHDRFQWVRSVCPWDPNLSTNKWTAIKRKLYSNEILKMRVERYPRFLS